MKTFALLWAIHLSAVGAFSPSPLHTEVSPVGRETRSISFSTIIIGPASSSFSSSALFAGGFGGGGAGGSTKKAKGASTKQSGGSSSTKLKPKQQWDRYLDLKTETKIPVGIRMKEDDSEEWLQVGHVRSKSSAHTAISVALQRALIAEHAKRLFPLQVSPKKTLEWAYFLAKADGEKGDGEWTVVDKSILEDTTLPEGIEKMIGFEGTPDPATGFYCIYDGGKLKLGDESSFK